MVRNSTIKILEKVATNVVITVNEKNKIKEKVIQQSKEKIKEVKEENNELSERSYICI